MEVVNWNPRQRRPEKGRLRYLGRRVNNFGDLLGPLVVGLTLNRLGLVPPPERGESRLLTVGSILHLARTGDVVWGTGRNGKVPTDQHVFASLSVRAVRGPLTRDFLCGLGIETPEIYGDPALLLPELMPELRQWSTEKCHDLTIVPNFNDYRAMDSGRRRAVLDPCSDVLHCLRTIAQSKYVAASSLHALVIAESLGIPTVVVGSPTEPSFKYDDYYQGTGRRTRRLARSFEAAVDDIRRRSVAPPDLTWDSAALLAAFPADRYRIDNQANGVDPEPNTQRPQLRVLQSVPPLTTKSNPYLKNLEASLPQEVETRYYSIQNCLLWPFDVLHVQWPENLVRSRRRVLTLAKRAVFPFLMLRLSLTRVAVVQTVHNDRPHESLTRIEKYATAMVDRRTTLYIRLNGETPISTRPGVPSLVIPHGPYVSRAAELGRVESVPGRIVFFGKIRRYKNTVGLIEAFHGLDRRYTLEVIGEAVPVTLAEDVSRAASGEPRINLRLGFADEDDLQKAILESELVVLPYSHMSNSGAVLLALSLGRPVLVPQTPATAALADEVGPLWVQRYEGPITTTAICVAVGAVVGRRTWRPPDLSKRAWDVQGEAFYAAYRRSRRDGDRSSSVRGLATR
jgi:glycosyltransferase involved in cell wall biosynthesis